MINLKKYWTIINNYCLNFLTKLLSDNTSEPEPYSYEIKHGVNKLGEDVYVVYMYLPNTGFRYLSGWGMYSKYIQDANYYFNVEKAITDAESIVSKYKDKYLKHSISWDK